MRSDNRSYEDSEYDYPRQPEYIYRRRRIVVAVLAVVIVALLIWGVNALLSLGKDESPEAASSSSALPTSVGGKPQLTGAETAPEGGNAQKGAESPQEDKDSGGEVSGSQEPTSEESSASRGAATDNQGDSGTCTVDSLEVVAQSDSGDYPAEQLPVFHISVSNPTKVDCVIDTSKDSLRFEVYSMQDNSLMWVDTDCNDPVVSGKETFPAGDTRVFEAQWSRTQSAPDQCTSGERAEVPTGSYYLHGVIGNNASEPVPFNLG